MHLHTQMTSDTLQNWEELTQDFKRKIKAQQTISKKVKFLLRISINRLYFRSWHCCKYLLPFKACCQRSGCLGINKDKSQFSSDFTTHPFADTTSDFIFLAYVTVNLCDTFSLITHFDRNDWEIPTPRSIHSRRSDISRPSFTIVCLTQLTRGQRTRSPGIFPPPRK